MAQFGTITIDHYPKLPNTFSAFSILKMRGYYIIFPLIILGPHLPEFLLSFRRPKRIRTDFGPSQLHRLEQVFEKNQYVVGAEQKELAKTLNLSYRNGCIRNRG